MAIYTTAKPSLTVWQYRHTTTVCVADMYNQNHAGQFHAEEGLTVCREVPQLNDGHWHKLVCSGHT
jgi:hypothetical protein